ncbi:MAG: hypothetical protein AAB421_04485 [Patescibacteria group bacterium]
MAQHLSIEEIFLTLLRSLKRARSPVEETRLRALYKEQRYTEMVGVVREALNIPIGLRVGYVNSGGDERNPAWIILPNPMPIFGGSEFKRLEVTMFIRRSFIAMAPFETIVIAMAHELCHIILSGTRHPLCHEERAVDITAMLLGFAELYEQGTTFIVRRPTTPVVRPTVKNLGEKLREIIDAARGKRGHVGYLQPDEVRKMAQAVRIARATP